MISINKILSLLVSIKRRIHTSNAIIFNTGDKIYWSDILVNGISLSCKFMVKRIFLLMLIVT